MEPQKSGALHEVHFPDRAGKGDKAERSGHSGGEGPEMLKVKRPKYLYGEVKVSGLGGVGGNIQQITEAF